MEKLALLGLIVAVGALLPRRPVKPAPRGRWLVLEPQPDGKLKWIAPTIH